MTVCHMSENKLKRSQADQVVFVKLGEAHPFFEISLEARKLRFRTKLLKAINFLARTGLAELSHHLIHGHLS